MSIKKRIIKLLFQVLFPELEYRGIDEKRINEWLAQQANQVGFYDYFRQRDLTLLKTLGQGLEDKDYLLRVGQRMELLHLISKVDEAHKKKEAELKKLQKEAEQRTKEGKK